MLELMYKETFETELSKEPPHIQKLVGLIWNMALQSINRQIIYISYEEDHE
jgi:hypothetical protein